MSHSDIPFVYLARRKDGVWKIGFTSNPAGRLIGLRSQFRQPFKMVKLWQRPDAYRVEQLAHRLLRLYMHLPSSGRETFKCPRKLVLRALQEALQMADRPIPETTKKVVIPPIERKKAA